MGLFMQRPEQNEDWAGLPSEPVRHESEAERLADSAHGADALGALGIGIGPGGATESVVIPVEPEAVAATSTPAADADD